MPRDVLIPWLVEAAGRLVVVEVCVLRMLVEYGENVLGGRAPNEELESLLQMRADSKVLVGLGDRRGVQ